MKKSPVQVLEQCKKIYLKKSKKETGLSAEDIIETYKIGVNMLNKLKIIRDDQRQTIRYLKVKSNRNSYKCNLILLETWLVQSMSSDDTYLYAYNYLSQKANSQEGYNMFPVKYLTDYELYDLLENEASDLIVKHDNEELDKSTFNKDSHHQRNKVYKGNDYALAFILECFAKDEKPQIYCGEKNKLEKIGNSIMGRGRGNTFYKCFNNMISKVSEACSDLSGDSFFNTISDLVTNEDWQNSVLEVSNSRALLEDYLKEKSKPK